MRSDSWLIVGLGNPGPQYEQTRHNIGFWAIAACCRRWGASLRIHPKFQAAIGEARAPLGGQEASALLAQPMTFMNASGDAVGKLLRYYRTDRARLIVISDEMALPLGRLRLRAGGSDGGHNGLKSIIQALGGDQDFTRLRLGIGPPVMGGAGLRHHVLSAFDATEAPLAQAVCEASVDALACVMGEGLDAAMTRFNGFVASPPRPSSP